MSGTSADAGAAATGADSPEDADLGGEVALGSALFTLVEPHKGHEVAYHRWYERDHFYAGCMIGPWYFAGRRWVATRALKDLRLGADDHPGRADGKPPAPLFGDDGAGSFLALYWTLKGRFRENTDWATRQVHWLHRNGRMFPHRDHVHTLLYIYQGAEHRDPDGVPPELALDHPFRGLAAVVVEQADDGGSGDDGDGAAGADTRDRPRWAQAPAPGSDVAMVLSFRGVPLPPDAPVSQPGAEGAGRRELQLWFADREPESWWPTVREYADRLHEEGEATVRWAAPFVPTIPGTDTYCDQLW